MLIIFLVLISYGMGLFGAIHTGILHSIAARAYLFETIRNRSDVIYFRGQINSLPEHYKEKGIRISAIKSEKTINDDFVASKRRLAVGRVLPDIGNNIENHNTNIHTLSRRSRNIEVSPIWIMIQYGLCVTASCGEQ